MGAEEPGAAGVPPREAVRETMNVKQMTECLSVLKDLGLTKREAAGVLAELLDTYEGYGMSLEASWQRAWRSLLALANRCEERGYAPDRLCMHIVREEGIPEAPQPNSPQARYEATRNRRWDEEGERRRSARGRTGGPDAALGYGWQTWEEKRDRLRLLESQAQQLTRWRSQ